MGGEHAPLAPSFAPVWGHCSAAPVASMGAPNLDSPESREGEAAHWVISQVLFNYRDKGGGPVICSFFIGKTAPNGVVIDEKMAEGAEVHVRDVMDVVGNGHIQQMRIEHRVTMPSIHAQNWGTLDTSAYIAERNTLYLWDYKHGHRERRAEGNFQLIDYAEGLMRELNIDGLQDRGITVVLRIVQPFCYRADGPVDEWVGKLSDLRAPLNVLRNKAAEVFTAPVMTTGAHCRDCPGMRTCSARRKADYNLIDLANEPFELDTMGSRDLAVEWRILCDGLAAAKARLDAIEDELAHRISGGAADTGLALEASYGRLAWTVPNEQAEALASQFGFSVKTGAIKTPTQSVQAAPKEVRAIFEQTLKTVTKRPSGKLKLINADDTIGARAFKRK